MSIVIPILPPNTHRSYSKTLSFAICHPQIHVEHKPNEEQLQANELIILLNENLDGEVKYHILNKGYEIIFVFVTIYAKCCNIDGDEGGGKDGTEVAAKDDKDVKDSVVEGVEGFNFNYVDVDNDSNVIFEWKEKKLIEVDKRKIWSGSFGKGGWIVAHEPTKQFFAQNTLASNFFSQTSCLEIISYQEVCLCLLKYSEKIIINSKLSK